MTKSLMSFISRKIKASTTIYDDIYENNGDISTSVPQLNFRGGPSPPAPPLSLRPWNQQPATEMYNSYSAFGVTVTACVTPISTNQFPPQHHLVLCANHSCPCSQRLSLFYWACLFVWLPQHPK